MYRQLQALFRLPRRVAGNAIRPKPSPATIVRKRLYWRFYLVFFVVAVAAACSISCLSVAASSCCPNTDSSGAGSCSMLPGSLYTFARNREIQARISLARTRIRQSAKPKALDHTTDQCSLSTFDGAKPKLWALSRSHTRNMRARDSPASIRRYRHGADPAGMAREPVQRLAAFQVPDPPAFGQWRPTQPSVCQTLPPPH